MNAVHKTILIVENDPALFSLLKLHLEKPGWEILNVKRLESAVSFVSKNRADLVLMDLCDLGPDATSLLEELKRNAAGRCPKVVGVSKSADQGFIRESIPLFSRMDLFFLPPFSFELMVQMIRKMLSPKSSVRDSNTVPRAPLPDSVSGGSA